MKTPSENSLRDNTLYVSLEEVVTIHKKMLEVGGGRKGIRDFILLHSAVEIPKATFSGKSLYSSLWLKGAALIRSLIRNRPFDDGNKRTAYFSVTRFLFLNGYELKARKEEIIPFTLAIDTKRLSVEKIAFWLKDHAEII